MASTPPIADPPIADPPSPKREKVEEEDSDSDDSDDGTPEEIQRFYDEYDKSQGFEMDFTKFTFCFTWKQLDLEDDVWIEQGQTTNRDLIAMLCNMALSEHKAKTGTKLELIRVLRANFHHSAAVTFYISFEVSDPCDANQTIPYRAVVRYLPKDIEVISFDPRPSS